MQPINTIFMYPLYPLLPRQQPIKYSTSFCGLYLSLTGWFIYKNIYQWGFVFFNKTIVLNIFMSLPRCIQQHNNKNMYVTDIKLGVTRKYAQYVIEGCCKFQSKKNNFFLFEIEGTTTVWLMFWIVFSRSNGSGQEKSEYSKYFRTIQRSDKFRSDFRWGIPI